jgi:hypothetical protein
MNSLGLGAGVIVITYAWQRYNFFKTSRIEYLCNYYWASC